MSVEYTILERQKDETLPPKRGRLYRDRQHQYFLLGPTITGTVFRGVASRVPKRGHEFESCPNGSFSNIAPASCLCVILVDPLAYCTVFGLIPLDGFNMKPMHEPHKCNLACSDCFGMTPFLDYQKP